LPGAWLERCLDSARIWASLQGYQYRFEADELFERLDPKLRERTAGRPVIAADLARLVALQQALAEGFDAVVWLDADTLIMDSEAFALPVELYGLGREDALVAIGMNIDRYGALSYADSASEYPSSQKIAEACFFLGADGIVVPNARHDSLNVVVFCDQDPAPQLNVVRSHGIIGWS
jgi:hypothetical protein